MASGIPITQEEFIEMCKLKHGEYYDLSLVEYTGMKNIIKIICPIHGEFEKRAVKFVHQGQGCQQCGNKRTADSRRLKYEDFINRAKNIHGEIYTYDKNSFINGNTHIKIICKIHGEFSQKPNKHLSGQGCPFCGVLKSAESRRKTTSQFITESKIVHGDRYDYSLSEYVNDTTNVKIICKQHGLFEQLPFVHLNSVHGCPQCYNEISGDKFRLSNEDFIKRAIEKYGDRYDYSKVEYISNSKEVEIICKIHGSFMQRPYVHMYSIHGCPECYNETKCGENNSNYNPELSDEDRIKRRGTKENARWRKQIFEKNNYTCVKCNNRSSKGNPVYLHAHHLNGYHWCEEGRFDIENGATLCEDCHNDFHGIYGKGFNTKEQFEEFMELELTKEDIVC